MKIQEATRSHTKLIAFSFLFLLSNVKLKLTFLETTPKKKWGNHNF